MNIRTYTAALFAVLALSASAEGGIRSWDLWRDTSGHVINADGTPYCEWVPEWNP